MKRLGIIAGEGQFPYLVAKRAKELGYYVCVCSIEGQTTQDFTSLVDAVEHVSIGKLQKTIQYLHKHSTEEVCFAGAINKTRAFSAIPDFRMTKILFSLLNKGDDSLLHKILKEFEKEGFTIIQAADILPTLRFPEGIITHSPVSEEIQRQIDYALPIIKTIGSLDIGQCIVVHNNMVVAVEAVEGTDETLIRAGKKLKNCVALKIAKPFQDDRVDLPSIGIKTIEILAQYNYTALVVEAYQTLFFDMEESIALANTHSITLIGIHIQK
ncbi:MAG: LpxI family protein [Desulfovibrionaceae bacterium]